ncbi:aminopeptidase P family protein [Granulicoccus phenolivorans]|uniref:aminopeptidase P family protein n=1 Tax=Granulicoccus phenolivorans TaxID=266854 RepID=UPI0003FB9B8C|nr:aminopeptidase P family protein [Granulicoccus phenolivorans]
MSEEQPAQPKRLSPFSEAFVEFIPTGWAPHDTSLPDQLPAAAYARARRAAISDRFPGERLVIPAGGLKVRNNDCDYLFRPHSAFAHLTGLGTDREPDAVLVLEPTETDGTPGHDAILFFRSRAPRTSEEFYADARYGEMWVGKRESAAEMQALTGLEIAEAGELEQALGKNIETVATRIVRDADPALTDWLDRQRSEQAGSTAEQLTEADTALGRELSELRLVKDDFEIDQMRQACARSAEAFDAVAAELPEAVRRGRGERWVEGIFGLHARHAGNAVGYSTIAAAGDHATTLHWVRNDGELGADQLLLVDAGVELDTLYTADITRTVPVSGRFSAAQRTVYNAVLAAQQAGIDAARPGASFDDIHRAAVRVIVEHLAEWGILPVGVEEALSPDGGQWRRWMVHGTSHHLGMDVHDCAQALRENYRGTLRAGMIVTVEPGLYFKEADLLVPEEFRGIGVRIEDDILITADGCEILSHQLPRTAEDVEAWLERSQ